MQERGDAVQHGRGRWRRVVADVQEIAGSQKRGPAIEDPRQRKVSRHEQRTSSGTLAPQGGDLGTSEVGARPRFQHPLVRGAVIASPNRAGSERVVHVYEVLIAREGGEGQFT